MRTATTCILVILSLSVVSCGNETSESTGDSKEDAIALADSFRLEFDKKEALIKGILEAASKNMNKAELKAAVWTDLPEPLFFDASFRSYEKVNRGSNGQIIALKDGGVFDLEKMGQQHAMAWRDDITTILKKEGRFGETLKVKNAIRDYKAVRYLCVVKTTKYNKALLMAGRTGESWELYPATWEGSVLYFDMEDGSLLGGKTISAKNSANVKFEYYKTDEFEKVKKSADKAAIDDLRSKIVAQINQP